MNTSHAIKWSFLSEIASKAVQPLVFVILARLLTPEDYGVVASATMVISFSQVFWEAGMGKAIIQYQGDRKAAANVAFWVNNALGIVVAGILVAISGVVADKIFQDARVAPVLQVMAVQVFLSASASIHTALLQKDLNFKSLFWVRMATVAIPGLFSIPLAWYGMGYWALVAGTLAGQTMQVAMLWKMSPWKPELSFDVSIARRLVRFGGWVALSGLLGWFYVWADSLIVGIYLGPRDLGLYRIGNGIVSMIYGSLFAPLMPILYSYISFIDNKFESQIIKSFSQFIGLITFISIPLSFIIFLSGDQIQFFILGEKWLGAGLAISVLALAQGFGWIVYPNVEFYRGLGRPDLETKIMILTLFLYLPVYIFSASIGLATFLWARLALVLIAILAHWWILAKNFKINFLEIASPLKTFLPVPLFLSLFLKSLSMIGMIDPFEYRVFAGLSILIIILYTAFLGKEEQIPYILNRLKMR
jgi:O-antigen/teichoic acid export membrane protein